MPVADLIDTPDLTRRKEAFRLWSYGLLQNICDRAKEKRGGRFLPIEKATGDELVARVILAERDEEWFWETYVYQDFELVFRELAKKP